MTEILIRELVSHAELRASEGFQHAVWGRDDPVDNADLLLAIQHEGGLVAGAFDSAQMLGFVFAFPSATAGVQHSHRLGVLPEARGLRLGEKLKWFQRDWCLTRGISRVRWTYDPLRAINAGLNIHKLSGTTAEYLINIYGEMAGINAGLPSDRVVVDWRLDSPSVCARARGAGSGSLPGPHAAPTRIAIPSDIDTLLRDDPAAAQAARLALRDALTQAFDKGLRITGFDPAQACYLLTPDEPAAPAIGQHTELRP